jgi:dihydroorotase
VECHPLIRSREACFVSTKRAIKRALRLGTRLHILHLSTKEEILLLGNTNNSKITGEVCVHHLWFTDDQYKTLGTRIKCNPAVKGEEDRAELRKALNDGRIAVIATDHAPHLLSEKEGGALKAASGMPLVQFSLLAMLELAAKGITSIENVIKLMCHNPATLYNIYNRGFIRKGYYADLVVVDPTKPTNVTPEIIKSRCGWSPFEGHIFPYSIDTTIVNGKIRYHQGNIIEAPLNSMPLKFISTQG